MPATIDLVLDIAVGPCVYPARVHGAACAATGTHGEGDTGPPFSVHPMGTEVEGSAPWRLSWLAEREPPSLPTTVVFGDARCPVSSTTVRRVSYAELAGSAPVGHAHLRVTSPMFFSRNGRDHPLPDPGLMLRSAATRWNRHAPAALAVPDDALRELAKLIYLADFEGRTARVPVSATMSQTGYVGEVHLALVRIADRSARVTFAALTRFAALAGLGAQTTHGFGAVDMLEPAR